MIYIKYIVLVVNDTAILERIDYFSKTAYDNNEMIIKLFYSNYVSS